MDSPKNRASNAFAVRRSARRLRHPTSSSKRCGRSDLRSNPHFQEWMCYAASYTKMRQIERRRLREFGAGRAAEIPRPQGSGEIPTGTMEMFKMKTTNGKTNKGQIARSVRFDIATDKNDEFHTLFRNEVLPTLKKQIGFKDELLLVQDQHVLAISFWNDMDSARNYESTTYPQLDRKLRPLMSGQPTVETFKYDALSTIA